MWLDAAELRVGLGCMRLSTSPERDQAWSLATVAAALDAGVTIFDTAHAYGRDDSELGHNERLLAEVLRDRGMQQRARIITKGGMRRAGIGWIPDGRARTIAADCEASLAALDGLPIDLYLLHAPDPRTPLATSIRALARLVDAGMVKRVGVANVNRDQLDQAMSIADISAVQLALSVLDSSAIRGGLIDRCQERGIALIAHSPLGGPRRVRALRRHPLLADIATAHGATSEQVALAWLLDLAPVVIAIPGARRPEAARAAAQAAHLRLTDAARATLDQAFGARRSTQRAAATNIGRDIVLLVGIPGAGKSRVAERYETRHYVRLNRDERGGTLRDIADHFDRALTAGERNVVLDNTYLTRAARSHVLDVAQRHGAGVRCVWLDTPLAQAQVNMVERLLTLHGSLPGPDELRSLARREPGVHTPTTQMRTLRELEPPSDDEGFSTVERLAFTRAPADPGLGAGVFVAAGAFDHAGLDQAVQRGDPSAPHLIFDWSAEGDAAQLAPLVSRLAAAVPAPVEAALCPHAGGAPTCWCRPPLPGLVLAFARRRRIDPGRSVLIGRSPAHRILANALGARYVAVS